MSNGLNTPRRPVVLIILDGFGISPSKINNAIAQANTPVLDNYYSKHPHTMLQASGNAVGLPDGQMGNSEVGHLTLGCGTVVQQNLVLIDDAISSYRFDHNPVFLDAIMNAKKAKRPMHIFGLVSDGGVHSHIVHLKALISLCAQHEVKPLLHFVADGRDTAPQSALSFLDEIEPALEDARGAISTVMGRYYAMDRDQHWERIEPAWQAIVNGKGHHVSSARNAIETAYASNQTDEFIQPVVIQGQGDFQDGDSLISFNFRKDRVLQMIPALGAVDFTGFERNNAPRANITCMMAYSQDLQMPVAFEADLPSITLGQVISEAGLKQFHCAETEKYAHVTYFFNGGKPEAYDGETRCLIPSPNVATYDLMPEMSAEEVADNVVKAINDRCHDFVLVNFANGDMVGHTANLSASIKAVEALDTQVGKVLAAAEKNNFSVVMTADHGNCEEIVDPGTGAPQTQHTTYPVPCLIIDEHVWQLSCSGGLSAVAPTVLQLMGLETPTQMTGETLLLKVRKTVSHDSRLQGAA